MVSRWLESLEEQNSKENSFVITKADWRDLGAVRELEKICFPKDAWPMLDLLGVLTMPNVIRLKAIEGEKMVGFVAGDIRYSEKRAWIATIGVLPEYRRQGIGSALLQACEERLPVKSVRLCVRAENKPAIEMYRVYGYQETAIWPRYYTDRADAVVMEKEL
jgi:ribosomal protein S18 acetylase RimI-like enzyme